MIAKTIAISCLGLYMYRCGELSCTKVKHIRPCPLQKSILLDLKVTNHQN